MEISQNSLEITKIMKHITTININPKLDEDGRIEIFCFPINAKRFDKDRVIEGLFESVIEFSLSRKTQDQYKGKHRTLNKLAVDKFKEWKNNTGELGEFLLFCFLEGHLNAPKILSKLELKTSNKLYVNGSDGVHFLNLRDNQFQLIFGESKLEKELTDGLRDAFKSIYHFINEINEKNDKKSGINFERSLISSNLDKEIFTNEEKELITKIIYPIQGDDAPSVDDSFGIFVGFEMDIEEARKTKSKVEFNQFVEEELKLKLNNQIQNITNYIEKYDLYGYTFYIYVLPFAKLDEDRKTILEGFIG